jgi:hypothetical protein
MICVHPRPLLASKGNLIPAAQRIEIQREREGGDGKPLELSQLTERGKRTQIRRKQKNRGLFQSYYADKQVQFNEFLIRGCVSLLGLGVKINGSTRLRSSRLLIKGSHELCFLRPFPFTIHVQ